MRVVQPHAGSGFDPMTEDQAAHSVVVAVLRALTAEAAPSHRTLS